MALAHGKRDCGYTLQDSWQTDNKISGNESQLTGSICFSSYVKEYVPAGTWRDRRPGGVLPSRFLKNPFDHPPDPLPGQEGGGNYIWGTPPDPCQRGRPIRMGTPSGLSFFITLLKL